MRDKGGVVMKKFLGFLFAVLLLLPIFASAEVDVKSLSTEELLALRVSIVDELMARGEMKSANVPAGEYVVGDDIPAGSYSITTDQLLVTIVVGDYDEDFKLQLDARIAELGITDNVVITGKLQTHDDVIDEIKKARFALLPLKIDFISGTIREAIACGLPVVTTITAGTPTLNEKRESVLLSTIGDHEALAANMIRLIDSEDLSDKLIANGLETIDEMYGNKAMALKLRDVYKALYAKFTEGKEIPEEFYTLNPQA